MNVTTPRVHGIRMGLMSPADGWATGFGTNGIGQRATATLPENWFFTGGLISTGSTVDSKGQPVIYNFTETATQYNVWSAIAGATGGGEGGTGLGGYTKDTGGAPSAGESGAPIAEETAGTTTAARVDTKVYAKLPSSVQVNTAFNVLSTSAARTATLVSNTRSTCVVSTRQVIAVATGRCTVVVNRKSDGTTLRTLRTTVTKKASTKGSQVTVGSPIVFSQASARLSKKARAQIAAIATAAAGAKSIVVVGHAAALTESPFNFAISRNRANVVRDALRRAKVKAPVTATWRGTLEQISTRKTEAAQAKNRRVVVYLVP
jgi:outer membrane protein OmpA-like peptidoglycan-associated protein